MKYAIDKLTVIDMFGLVTAMFLFAVLLMYSGNSPAAPREFRYHVEGGSVETVILDLTKQEDQMEFRRIYGGDSRLLACMQRADYAIDMMKRRDQGEPESYHLAEVKAKYDETKTSPEGAVAYHIYVDFQRMVRDIHRAAGSSGLHAANYQWQDHGVFWEREFFWCYYYGRTGGY